MNNLRSALQNDLDLIDERIASGYSNKDIIFQNIDTILSIAFDQKMRLKRKDNVKKIIKEYRNYSDEISNEYIDNYHKLKKFNYDITKMAIDISQIYGYETIKFKEKISIDDAIKVDSKFLKEYDKDMYDYFENFMLNGKFFIVDNIFEGYGYSSVSDELLDPYIILCKSNNIFYITVLMHELVHVYLSEKEKYMTKEEASLQYINGVSETYSIFIEFLVIDYLQKNNLFKKDIISYKKDIYFGLIEYLKSLYLMIDPCDICFDSYDEVGFYNESKIYSYGYLLAYHFYEQYLNDRDQAKENITNFMLDSKKYEFDYLINNYGLNEKEITDNKLLLKHIEKIY